MSNRNFSLPLHLSVVLLAFVVSSLAQMSQRFQWRFDNNFTPPSLPSCVSIPVLVEPTDVPTNNTGNPPFYMIALVVGGPPVTRFIGTDKNNLSWTVTEPIGSQLLLNVVDGNGNAGRILPNVYTVIAGQTTRCITTPLVNLEFKITTNVTQDLSTCQPWELNIEGGVPPYNITLLAVNSHITTNVPVPGNNFTIINTAEPGTQLLYAVSDFIGRWADGTAIVNTTGSPNTSCTDLVGSSSNSTTIQQQKAISIATSQSTIIQTTSIATVTIFQPQATTTTIATGQSNRRHVILVAVSVTLSLFMIDLIVAGFLYLRIRRKKSDAKFAPTPSKVLSSGHDLVTRTASGPVLPNSSSTPVLYPTSTRSVISVPNHTQGQGSQVLECQPSPAGAYNSVDDTATYSPRSMYFLPSFAQLPLTSIREDLNTGPSEPALSDADSNVLPRSIRSDSQRKGERRQVERPRHDSE